MNLNKKHTDSLQLCLEVCSMNESVEAMSGIYAVLLTFDMPVFPRVADVLFFTTVGPPTPDPEAGDP
jgi:hypothetical protein